MRLRDFESSEKPREKLIEHGVETLSAAELMALVLCKGSMSIDVLELSHNLVKKYPLQKLRYLSYPELVRMRGIGGAKACQILAAVELGRRSIQKKPSLVVKVDSPKSAFHLLRNKFSNEMQEHFICLFLNARKGLICSKTLFLGTIDKQLISVREIAKVALEVGATGVILSHNHPSGDCNPSEHDIRATKKIRDSLDLFDIELLDHIVIAEDNFCSMVDEGLI
jgi:DNA repair protein RadC